MGINPFSVISFANIFSHFVGCLCVFLEGFLCCAKAFKFNQIPFVFVVVAFVSFALGDRSEKYCYNLCQIYVFLFFSRNFMVSHLAFRPLIHFEFISVYGMRKCSNVIFLHVAVQFSWYHLLNRLSFLHCIFWPSLSYIN